MPLAFWANKKMFDELSSYAESKGATMTVFVDDITFSGNSVNSIFKRRIQEIIANAGLTPHPNKCKLIKSSDPKLITGVIVGGKRMTVRNKHHKAIYSAFFSIRQCKTDEELKKLYEQLIGRLNAAGQIERKYKQKAAYLQGAVE